MPARKLGSYLKISSSQAQKIFNLSPSHAQGDKFHYHPIKTLKVWLSHNIYLFISHSMIYINCDYNIPNIYLY